MTINKTQRNQYITITTIDITAGRKYVQTNKLHETVTNVTIKHLKLKTTFSNAHYLTPNYEDAKRISIYYWEHHGLTIPNIT